MLEAEQQKIKLDKFVADGAEDWDIKNAVRKRLTQPNLSQQPSHDVLDGMYAETHARGIRQDGDRHRDPARRGRAGPQATHSAWSGFLPTAVCRRDVPRPNQQVSAEQDSETAKDEEVLKAKEVLEEVSV